MYPRQANGSETMEMNARIDMLDTMIESIWDSAESAGIVIDGMIIDQTVNTALSALHTEREQLATIRQRERQERAAARAERDAEFPW